MCRLAANSLSTAAKCRLARCTPPVPSNSVNSPISTRRVCLVSLRKASVCRPYLLITGWNCRLSKPVLGYGQMKTYLKLRVSLILATAIFTTLFEANSSLAQTAQVFRLDGGNSTYAFGVNEHGELQPLYWGGRLSAHDTFPSAHSFPEVASFDSPYTTTPQEYAGWGAGLFTEAALKVTFADGNRDLILHFVRATPDGEGAVKVLLKDVSREIFVTLRYSIDPE